MKNAPKHQKKSITAKSETTLTFSKNNVATLIAKQLLGPADAFNVALVKQQLNSSTQADMAGHWSHVENQRYLNHLIGQYYVAND